MPSQDRYSFELDFEDSSFTSHPPQTPQQQQQLKPRGQGYQVAQTASYLPQPDGNEHPSPSPLPRPPPEHIHRTIPPVPSLDSYYQFHTQRGSWTATPAVIEPEPERPPRMSAYRRDRVNEAAVGTYTDAEQQSQPPPPPPPLHREPFTQERPSHGLPATPHQLRPTYLPPIQTRPLSPLSSPASYLSETRRGSPTRSDVSFLSESSRALTQYHAPSISSSTALAAAAIPPARRTASPSPYQLQYDNAPYSAYAPSSSLAESRIGLGAIDPTELADDDDDDYTPRGPSRRMTTSGGGGAAAGGVVLKAFGGAGREANKAAGARGGSYGQVHGGGASSVDGVEKSAWLSKQTVGKRRLRWWLAGGAAVVLLAVIGGVVGVFVSRGASSSDKPAAAAATNQLG